MKNFYFLLTAILFTSAGFGQVSENFNSFTNGSYGNYTYNNFSITNGLSETAANSRGGAGRAVRLRDSGTPSLEYIGTDGNGLDGGVGTISFWYRHWDGSPAISTINVEYSINGGAYVNIGTINNFTSTTYTEFSYSLNNTSDNIRVRVRPSIQERLIIDDFSITIPVACTPPSTQATLYYTSGITTTTGTLNWTRGNGNNVLVVMRQGAAVTTDPTNGTDYTANTVFGSGTEIGTGNYVVYNGSGTSVNVTGLTLNSNYHVAVYEYATTGTCYNSTELVGNFNTLCTSVSSLPFTEGFETGVPPTCWTRYTGANGLGTVEQWNTTTTNVRTGLASAQANFENGVGTTQDWLVTNAIDLSGSSNIELSFFGRELFNEPPNLGNSYTVRVSTASQTNISDFTDIVASYDETDFGVSYSEKLIDLSAYSGGTIYLAFVMEQTDGDSWLIDDISIYDNTPCTLPTTQASAFNATAIDGGVGTATLNWTRGNGDNVLVVMRAGAAVNTDPLTGTTYTDNAAFGAGDELGTGNFVVYNGPATSVGVSNLIANTTYHVAIYEYGAPGNCYNTTELTGSFLVPCNTYGLPFSEDFESSASIPSCWATYKGANDLGEEFDWTINTPGNGGGQAAYVNYENVIGGLAEDWMVTPAIAINADADAALTFFTRDEFDEDDYGAIYTVRVSTISQTDRNSFTTIQTYTETQLGSSYNQKIIDLSAYNNTTVYIAFVLTNDDGDSWFVDDVVVDALPPVPAIGWQIETVNDEYVIDFDTTVANVNNGVYTGTGFTPTPATGQLNSGAWAVTGLSDGALAFEGTATTTDFTQGTSPGDVTSGGLYAFEVAAGNYSFGVQPTGGDFTPGTVTLRAQNQTGSEVTSITFKYTIYIKNNESRSNFFNFAYSTDNITYVPQTTLDYTSPVASSGNAWTPITREITIDDLSVADDGLVYLRWSSDDVGGSGNRDEFALDDISVMFNQPMPIGFPGNALTGFGGAVGGSTLVVDALSTPTVDFVFNKGTGDFNDHLVIYIDSEAGGIATTANLTDTGDAGRKAISGRDGGNHSVITFPPGFRPEYAISMNNGFAGLFEIVEGGAHTFIQSANITPSGVNNAASYAFSIDFANISTSPDDESFKFLATYINGNNAFRSNESIGRTTAVENPGFGPIELETYYQVNSGLQGGKAPSQAAGVWTADASWLNGNAPLVTDQVTINNVIDLDTDVALAGITVNAVLDILPSYTLATSGGITGSGSVTVAGTLSITQGGFTTIAPTYVGGSTLEYKNIAGTYNRFNEWTLGAAPSNVILDNANLDLSNPAGSTTTENFNIGTNLSLLNAGSLNIDPTKSLTVGNAINNTSGTINVNSTSQRYASLIANSTAGSGTFNYNRHVNTPAVSGTGGNDLVSAPFSGEIFGVFAGNNFNIRSNPTPGLETQKLFGPFDKSTGTYLLWDSVEDSEETLNAGVGYRTASTDGGTFEFSGTMNTGNVNAPIVIGGPQSAIWNLIGNPYPSYIRLSDFLAANNSKFNASNGGVYGYNGSSGGYEIWNSAYLLLNPNAVITPGQGFLVASNSASETVNFTSGMRSIGTSDDFIAGRQAADDTEPVAYLQLKASIGLDAYTTDFYFTNHASRGLDANYDSGIFGSGSGAAGIYSQLVQENAGIDMGIQSIAYNDLGSDVSIPVGINVSQGQQVTFSMENTILPDGINVYLEDNLLNVFTLLNTNDYVFTPNSNLNAIGRFYLRFTDTTLSTGTADLDLIRIFAVDQTLHINGLLNSATTVSLYDIQGRLVLSTGLESGSTNNMVDASNISTGVYVVKLSNTTQQKTQRVIIK